MRFLGLFILLVCVTSLTAQKRELRNANRFFNSGQIQDAVDVLTENQTIFDSADEKTQVQLKLLQGKIARIQGDYKNSLDIFNSIAAEKTVEGEVRSLIDSLANDLVVEASEASERAYEARDKDNLDVARDDFLLAAENLYLTYQIKPDLYQDYLYFAASSAVQAQDTLRALEYYLLLKELKYSGITTKYYLTEVSTGEEREVTDTEYELFQKSDDYTDFREEETESRYPEIVRNVALLYTQLGDLENALNSVSEARQQNPEDIDLLLTEANIYLQTGERDKFQEMMEVAVKKDPNNEILHFNLGVVNSDLGNKDKAKEHYERSIEINPEYFNSYINLVNVILDGDVEIVDQMNNLGNTPEDNKKYDELKERREKIYKECIPILEKAISIQKDCGIIRTLMNIYGVLGDETGGEIQEVRELYADYCS